MNEKLARINDLTPIAKRIRERQEQIQSQRNKALAEIGATIVLIQEQGQDLILAKTKLGKQLRWSEWLANHVPSLPEALAAKFERVATEQITDPRQAIFAFLPPAEREVQEQRPKASAWETAWGYTNKLHKLFRDEPVAEWPDTVVSTARREVEPLARILWPEKFEG